VTFVSRGVDAAVLARRLGTRRTLVPVGGVRGLTRESLHANRATTAVEIDVRTGAVTLGGRSLAVDPVTEVPLSRRYLLR
jgi:urease subunit alpha